MDVEPLASAHEPVRIPETGGHANPRDGLVTIVAVVRGEEAFEDRNGNGTWDADEFFFDEEEPFVDANDNGQHDPGEAFRDTNQNGQHDGANGAWDAAGEIWRVVKVVWSGDAWVAPAAGTRLVDSETQMGSVHIPPGGARSVQAFFVDERLNPLAANDADKDEVAFVATRARLDGQATAPLRQAARAITIAVDPLLSTRLRIRDDRGAVIGFPGRQCDPVLAPATGLCFARMVRDNDATRVTPGVQGTLRATILYTPLPPRAAKILNMRRPQHAVTVGDIPIELDSSP